MKTLSLAFVIFLLSCSQSANDLKNLEKQLAEASEVKIPELPKGFKAHETDEFWVCYPDDWTLDTKEDEGLLFSIFSPLVDTEDNFQENVNMATEAMPNSSITPKYYAESALKMIEAAIPEFKLIENNTTKGKYSEYQKLVYTGEMGGLQLQWKQFVQVKNSKAYIVTFVSSVESFKEFDGVSEKILSSFIVK